MKKIGIIGLGFVGSAVRHGMKHVFEILINDNNQVCKSLADVVEGVDGPIFVCVPTPMLPGGACDTSIVEGVVREINEIGRNVTVVIKSTVLPGTTVRLDDECENINVCFNPEFLREATSIEDFKSQKRILLGGRYDGVKELIKMYVLSYPHIVPTITNSTTAEMVKYVTNCFLAVKVSFANEIEQICEKIGIEYGRVINLATKDDRLGDSHWQVPGPDGKKGFGGTCFPKDLNAIIEFANELKLTTHTMIGTRHTNAKVRADEGF